MPWVKCQTCQGNGKIYKEVKPGKWEWQACPAGCTNGKINTGTV